MRDDMFRKSGIAKTEQKLGIRPRSKAYIRHISAFERICFVGERTRSPTKSRLCEMGQNARAEKIQNKMKKAKCCL